jgi:uncharacterized RDD family membrane protein YckC
MSQSPRSNPFAPPLSEVAEPAPTGPAGAPVLAERGVRLAALALDTALLMLGLLLVSWLTRWDPFGHSEAFWQFDLVPVLWSQGAFLLLNAYLLIAQGQTIGKRVLGLRIVRPDGARAAAWRVLGLRYLAFAPLGLSPGLSLLGLVVDGLFIFRGSRRCLHDELADTVVVRT